MIGDSAVDFGQSAPVCSVIGSFQVTRLGFFCMHSCVEEFQQKADAYKNMYALQTFFLSRGSAVARHGLRRTRFEFSSLERALSARFGGCLR